MLMKEQNATESRRFYDRTGVITAHSSRQAGRSSSLLQSIAITPHTAVSVKFRISMLSPLAKLPFYRHALSILY